MFSNDQLSMLQMSLNPDLVKVKPNDGAKYLEHAYYIETANRIFGHGGWSFAIHGLPEKVESGRWGKKDTYYAEWAVLGTLRVERGGEFTDLGTCTQNGEGASALAMALKGAATDALKRCLRMYGDQFGLQLYERDITRAEMEAEFAASGGEPAAPRTGQDAPQQQRQAANSASHPATHAGVNAVMNVIARGAPAGTRPADIKEATAIALSVRPSEINKDIMADFLAAWLEQPGNTASAFQKKFLQALTELRERELSPA